MAPSRQENDAEYLMSLIVGQGIKLTFDVARAATDHGVTISTTRGRFNRMRKKHPGLEVSLQTGKAPSATMPVSLAGIPAVSSLTDRAEKSIKPESAKNNGISYHTAPRKKAGLTPKNLGAGSKPAAIEIIVIEDDDEEDDEEEEVDDNTTESPSLAAPIEETGKDHVQQMIKDEPYNEETDSPYLTQGTTSSHFVRAASQETIDWMQAVFGPPQVAEPSTETAEHGDHRPQDDLQQDLSCFADVIEPAVTSEPQPNQQLTLKETNEFRKEPGDLVIPPIDDENMSSTVAEGKKLPRIQGTPLIEAAARQLKRRCSDAGMQPQKAAKLSNDQTQRHVTPETWSFAQPNNAEPTEDGNPVLGTTTGSSPTRWAGLTQTLGTQVQQWLGSPRTSPHRDR